MDGLNRKSNDVVAIADKSGISDPTAKIAEARLFYSGRMKMVEDAAKETDPTLGGYILLGVTEGLSYDSLAMKYPPPCCKDTYYEMYRRFFWLLNTARQ